MTALLRYSGGGGGPGRGQSSGRGRGGGHYWFAGRGRGDQRPGRRHHQRPHPGGALPFDPNQRTNQWVRPKTATDGNSDIAPSGASGADNMDEISTGSGTKEGQRNGDSTGIDAVVEPTPDTKVCAITSKHVIMTKHGRNRLVLSSSIQPGKASSSSLNDGAIDAAVSRGIADDREGQAELSPGKALMREGKHKLVAVSKGGIETKKPLRLSRLSPHNKKPSSTGLLVTTGSRFNPKYPAHRSSWSRNKRGYPPMSTRHPASSSRGVHPRAAKRIKLNNASYSEKDNVQGANSAEDDDDGQESSGDDSVNVGSKDQDSKQPINTDEEVNNGQLTEKLTDFAYRETSRVRHRLKPATQNLHWSKTSAIPILTETKSDTTSKIGRNMGLVRVQPDEKKTPICKLFLRGVECTNAYCRKRHDVPKEHAMPVCSFFQRHGQCLKGDKCPFRHVKVNSKATICPSFSLLGFCDNKECSMQHVRPGGGNGGSAGKATSAPGSGGILVSSKR